MNCHRSLQRLRWFYIANTSGKEMPGRGLEPLILAEPDPKSGASANFATPAYLSRSGSPESPLTIH